MMRNRIAGLAACAIAVLALVLVFHPPRLPWQPVFSFRIATPAFSQLQPGATVDLAGKQVGQVDSLTIEHGLPLLTVHIDGADAHLLHANASATIQPHGLLGTQYIELDGGSAGRLPPGGLIPASHVRVAVTLDQVLNIFQATERQNLQTLIVELGTASAGRGKDLNQSLRALGDASTSLALLTETLRRHDQGISGIIGSSQQLNQSLQHAPLGAQLADTDAVLAGLAGVDGSIGHGIDHTAAVLSDLDVILRGNIGNLRYALARSPRLVAQLRTLMAGGNAVLKGVNPALPALLTAIVEAGSAFSGRDANGHFVRILSVTGACTLGLNLGCSGGTGQGGPPVPAGLSGAHAAGKAASMSDRSLENLFFAEGLK